jgi:hypothetical protein
MKKLIIIILWVSACDRVFAQADTSDKPHFIIDLGINQPVVTNTAFNLWAGSNYNKNVSPGISGMFDIAIAGKWDGGLHLSAANPYLIAGFEFGKRLTPAQFPIASYINLDFGWYNAMFNDLAPVGYKLTPDQQGQQMQLKSINKYFGITSRNYFSRFGFFIGRGHNATFASGFYVTGGWAPFRKQWEYGYYTNDGSDADGIPTYDFNSVKVYGIPNISNFFIDTGLFVGVSF